MVFILRGRATGALLNVDADRSAAQSMLDYWVTFLYRTTRNELDETLLDVFDPVAAGKELPDEAYPFEGDLLADKRGSSLNRQKLVDLCIAKIEENHLLAVVGPAGSGRTWLVTEALLPALKERLFGSAHWRYLTTAPGSEPLAALARLIQPPNADPTVWVRDQVQRFRKDPTHLTRLINAAGDEPTVLVIDRFGQVFAVPDERQMIAFVENLLGLIKGPKAVHTLILIMRSDFLTRVDQLELLQKVFRNGQVFVGFDLAELRQTIHDRAQRVGLNFEEGLVDQLLLDVQGDPSPLTLLQFTLRRLWPERKANWITWESYNRLGGGRLALERVAEAVFRELTDNERKTLKRVLLCLAQPGASQEFIVHRVRRDDLYKTGEPRDQVDRVLGQLLRVRLVHKIAGATPSDSEFALAHEALASHWAPLVEWLSELRDTRRRRLRLTAAAEQWRDKHRDAGALWGGSLLQEASAYVDRDKLENEFVQASARAERWATIRKYAFIGTGFVGTIAALSIWVVIANCQTAAAEARAAAEAAAADAATATAVAEAAEADTATATAVAEAARADAEATKAKAEREAKLKLTVANGMGPLENGDTAGGLIWFADALGSDTGKPSQLEVDNVHQTRIAVGLRQLPILAQFWHLTPWYPNEANDSNQTPNWNVWAAKFNHDGGLLLTASGEQGGKTGAAHLLDTATGESRVRFPHDDGRVNNAALSRDGKIVATASISPKWDKGQVQLWNAETGTKLRDPFVQEKGGVNHVAFSPDGRYLVMTVGDPGSNVGEAQLWDSMQQTLRQLNHQGPVHYAAFSPDSSYLVTASGEAGGSTGWAKIWDLNNPSPEPIRDMFHKGQVNRAVFSSDGRSIVTASGAQGAEVGEAQMWEASKAEGQRWDWKTAERVKTFEHRAGITCAEFSPDNRLVVSATHDGDVMLRHVKTRRWLHTFNHGSSVFDASFSPDGRYIVTASRDQTARVWEVATGDLAMPPMAHTGTVGAARFSSDGRRIFTVCKDTARLWEFATGNPPPKFLKPNGEIKRVWSSEDGRHVITVSERRGNEPGVAQLWDIDDADLQPQNLPYELRCAALSPNGQLVVMADRGDVVQIWDRNRKKTSTIMDKQDRVNYVAFSPDNRLVVVASGNLSGRTGQADVLNIETGKRMGEALTHTGGVISASFSSDSHRIVTASADNTAQVWDVDTGTKVGTPLNHPSDVMYASFSSDGHYVITASFDQTAVLWSAESSKKLATLRHNGYVSYARFSTDGKYVLTASHDGRARVWYLAPGNPSKQGDSETAPFVPELVAILKHGGFLQQASFIKTKDHSEIGDRIESGDRIVTVGYYLPRLLGDPGESPSARRRLIQVREWKMASSLQTTNEPQDLTRLLSAAQINWV